MMLFSKQPKDNLEIFPIASFITSFLFRLKTPQKPPDEIKPTDPSNGRNHLKKHTLQIGRLNIPKKI